MTLRKSDGTSIGSATAELRRVYTDRVERHRETTRQYRKTSRGTRHPTAAQAPTTSFVRRTATEVSGNEGLFAVLIQHRLWLLFALGLIALVLAVLNAGLL